MQIVELCESDGGEVYTHGAFIAPDGADNLKIHTDCERARQMAREANEAWTYEEVTAALRSMGYRETHIIKSWE